MSYRTELDDMLGEMMDPDEFGDTLTFDGKTAPCMSGEVAESFGIEDAGEMLMLDAKCVLRLVDFKTLRIKSQDEITIGDRQFRVVIITTEAPAAVLGLKAIR